MNIYEKIISLADEMYPELVAQRRDFHKYAETGWLEMRTSSLIARQLTDLGYEVLTGSDVCNPEDRMGVPSEEVLEKNYQRAKEQGADPEFLERTKGGMTGVIGILRCGEGPTMAMRFDIDALGVFESKEAIHRPTAEGFASVNYGMMHACGHDGHATIGLGVARVLMAIKDQLHGTVKLIFQPAEEGVRGAKPIVDKGHLDGVQYFLGSHLTNKKPEDPRHMVPGCCGSLATTKLDVIYRGLAAHAGGGGFNGKNALVAAANAVMNLYAIPRHSGGASRINVGTLVAGSGRNVIADEAKMELEVRGSNTQVNDYMYEKACRILENSARMYDVEMDLKITGAAESCTSDEDFCQQIRQVCTEHLGLNLNDQLLLHVGGSEDVSYMVNRVQNQGGKASFMRIMTVFYGSGHNRNYDFDEAVLAYGVKAFAGMVYNLLG